MRASAKLAAGAVTAGLGVTMVAGTGTALAAGPAPSPAAPSPADTAAAAKVAAAPAAKDRLATFFVHLDQHQHGKLTSQAVGKAAKAAKAPALDGAVRPVYTLNPAFVKGQDAPVAVFAYLAVGAHSATGQHATMWLTRRGKGWTVMNVISGTDEAAYPARAGGGTVFTEPQINAWYRLKDGRVTGLNPTATTSVGKRGVTVAAYRTLVRTRYADKLPGSSYQRSGRLGGYTPRTGVGKRGDGGGAAPLLSALGAGGALAAAAGIVAARRRRVPG
ncbi:hypothetical protein [Actinomadura montaniterrae]|uniref:LPXTG cell wall anchor domain-containing protein n=1 Tax=Actinomadura montaniterrae TaxID=1803903 RepID=A0A6L3VCT5_9ACTN|nr:hypothetical protein [Actinomadura montaniterrae]KAB2359063.1 hypothetical protein F9B16_47270 [Actinomadura montaniterrae]